MEQRLEYALTAARWLGTREGSAEHRRILEVYNSIRPLPRGYAVKESDAWCAAFVSAAAVMAGAAHLLPLECSCVRIVEQAMDMGIWQERDDYVPQIGELVLYNWDARGSGDDTGAPDHVGVVIGAENGELLVVEGNYSNAVKLRQLPVNDGRIRGFVCPKFEEGIMHYHKLEEIPAFARPTIEKLTADGSLKGISDDDLGLSEELLRTLVILDRRGML